MNDISIIQADLLALGHTLVEYKNNKNVFYMCKCGNTEVAKATLIRLRGGSGCDKCMITRRIATKLEKNTINNNKSQDVSTLRGNELAKRKVNPDIIKQHASDTITTSIQNSIRNATFNVKVIQLADIVIAASKFHIDGWVFIGYNEQSYFINRDGRFASAIQSIPIIEVNREFRNEYPQIKLDGRMVYIHREFAKNFSVVDISKFSTIQQDECFTMFDINTFRDLWLSKAKERKISSEFIIALSKTFETFSNSASVLVPTQNLQADHIIPNSRELYTAVRLVTTSEHVHDTIARGERQDVRSVLLFDTHTKQPLFMNDHTGESKWLFPSIKSIGEAICRTNNISSEFPANIAGPSFREKAVKMFEKNMTLPIEFVNSEWRYPILTTITKNENVIVISLPMFWTYICDKPEMQDMYDIHDAIEYDNNVKKVFGEKIDPNTVTIIKHPNLPFGFATNVKTNVITCDTVLKPVSLVKENLVQVLSFIIDKHGYPYIQLQKKHKYLHKMSAEIFLKQPSSSGKQFIVHHINGDTLNWHPSNLEWTTRSENSKKTPSTRDDVFHSENKKRELEWKFTIES